MAEQFDSSQYSNLVLQVLSHQFALQRIKGRGVSIGTFFDVGAAEGSWSEKAAQVYDQARFHLIEANRTWVPKLAQRTAAMPQISYVLAAAGPTTGRGHYWPSPTNPYGGRAFAEASPDSVDVPMISLDDEAERLGLPAPYAVKLDIHGFEEEVLAGAKKVLEQCELIICEHLVFHDEGQRFPRLVKLITDLGFQCVDIGEPLFRPHDMAFWQMDLFYVRRSRPEVNENY